jgi:hypothetical protein
VTSNFAEREGYRKRAHENALDPVKVEAVGHADLRNSDASEIRVEKWLFIELEWARCMRR